MLSVHNLLSSFWSCRQFDLVYALQVIVLDVGVEFTNFAFHSCGIGSIEFALLLLLTYERLDCALLRLFDWNQVLSNVLLRIELRSLRYASHSSVSLKLLRCAVHLRVLFSDEISDVSDECCAFQHRVTRRRQGKVASRMLLLLLDFRLNYLTFLNSGNDSLVVGSPDQFFPD